MSTSQTHFSRRDSGFGVKEKATVTSPAAALFPFSGPWRVLHFPAMISHKGDCEFLPLPFQQKLKKFLHSKK